MANLSTEEKVAWHSEGELWEEFVRWSRNNCSPTGNGHLVPWYWDIWKAASEAKDRMRNREGLRR